MEQVLRNGRFQPAWVRQHILMEPGSVSLWLTKLLLCFGPQLPHLNMKGLDSRFPRFLGCVFLSDHQGQIFSLANV